MSTILNAILIDVVEMVIVLSKNYELFQMLKKLIIRLQEPSRVSRINDKLTIICGDEYGYIAELNFDSHREYDKPYIIYKNGLSSWREHGKGNRNNDLPDNCNRCGSRTWRKGYNDQLSRNNSNPSKISMDEQYWHIDSKMKRENNLPTCISVLGHRYRADFSVTKVFEFLE